MVPFISRRLVLPLCGSIAYTPGGWPRIPQHLDCQTHSCHRQVQTRRRDLFARRFPLRPSHRHLCPAGKTLTTAGTLVNDGITLLYRGSTRDCVPCALKAQCCPNTPTRKIPRSIYERARDVARSLSGTVAFERSRHDRKRIEMRFAHLKRILRLGRLRLRGRRGAQDEFVLAAIAQNLRRLAKLVTIPSPRPVPA